MKLNEVLPEFEKGKLIRRDSWPEDQYLKYDIMYNTVEDDEGCVGEFSFEDLTVGDWVIVQSLEQKQLKKLYEIINNFSDDYIELEDCEEALLEVLRMK